MSTTSIDMILPKSLITQSSRNINWLRLLVITRLRDLSFSNLQGPLPPSITKLAHLKELNMSNNIFTDTIPAFPSSSTLTSVYSSLPLN
ncbi:hypothetical protein RJ639_043380 [Escallonia herrerae]|uniref:Uncharacterized protein n=1 Tax=Escallonia herrerae TaxID=1293975 RepID=A0AA89B4A4_9ASTE|nr:hypothetical protein RJ639_043380 [Escallonia herrerae]